MSHARAYQPRGELDGMRILRGVRVSSPHQVENWSTVAQEEEFTDKLVAMGAAVIAFDEEDISGRDMYKRKVFLRQLAKLDRHEAEGLAYYDMERLTRHELNRDAPLIAECLERNRAVFVTWYRVYRVWLEADKQAFLQDALNAGRDIRYRKHTMWRGIFGRASRELIPMGKATIGYRKKRDEFIRKSNGRLAPHPQLEKDPAQAEMMQALAGDFTADPPLPGLLDTCDSLQEVCRRMNRAGYLLESRRRKNRETGEVLQERGEKVIPWRANTILRMFDNPYYAGSSDFGRFSNRMSSVWEGRERADYKRDEPDLQYWTRAQVILWRRKFSLENRAWKPQTRKKKYDRGLIGVLACVNCGRPMVSSGRNGYQCSTQRDGRCDAAQVLGERGALLALREILPDLLPKKIDLLESAARVADTSRLTAMEEEHHRLSLKVKADTADWMALPSPRPEALGRAIAKDEQHLKTLGEDIELARANQLQNQAAIQQALGLLDHTVEVFDSLPSSAQMELYRLLASDVRIEGTGIARGRRWRVLPGYTALLRSTDNSPIASNWVQKLSFLRAHHD